jgi:hypothetical protein
MAVLLCFGASSLAGSPAAQNAARLKARDLYANGEKALDTGDVEKARRDFEAAYETLPNAAVLLKIAECKSRMADYRGAVEALDRYLTDRPAAPDRAAVESKIAALKSKPGVVKVTSSPTGASIWVDGTDSALVTPSELELAPGEHALEVRLHGYRSAEQSVVVEFASRKDLDVALEATSERRAAGASPPSSSSASEAEAGGYHTTPAFWVAVGGAIAGAGVTTAFGVIALDKQSQFDAHPSRGLYDDGRQAALVSDIALGVTGACAVTAAVLFFTSKGHSPAAEHALVVAPAFARTGAGLAAHFRF